MRYLVCADDDLRVVGTVSARSWLSAQRKVMEWTSPPFTLGRPTCWAVESEEARLYVLRLRAENGSRQVQVLGPRLTLCLVPEGPPKWVGGILAERFKVKIEPGAVLVEVDDVTKSDAVLAFCASRGLRIIGSCVVSRLAQFLQEAS